MRIISLLAIFLILSTELRSQNAPIPAEPEIGNKALIDSLMEVSRYKEYFIGYCDRQIDLTAKLNKWTFEKIRDRKINVNFEDFKKSTIYNWFSRVTKEELLDLIKILGKLNDKNSSFSFLITHSAIQGNLELFVKEYLK